MLENSRYGLGGSLSSPLKHALLHNNKKTLCVFNTVYWFISSCVTTGIILSIVMNVGNRDCFIITKNLKQRKMNLQLISDFSKRLCIHVDQYLGDFSGLGVNQPETHMWLAKCLPERIFHVCRKLSSFTTLRTFIPMCTSIVVCKETICHWTIASSIQSASKASK